MANLSRFFSHRSILPSALIEYHCSKDPAVATRIFELGLKVFGDRLEFVDRYLAFLIMINDDQSASPLLNSHSSLLSRVALTSNRSRCLS